MKRLDEDGLHALVQVSQPVNRFPDFVGYVVQRLKTLCPTLGKALIAKFFREPACISEQPRWAECSNENVGQHLVPPNPNPRQSNASSPPSTLDTCGTST